MHVFLSQKINLLAANKKGIVLHIEKLQKQLGIPVIPLIARNNIGLDSLKNTLTQTKMLRVRNVLYIFPLVEHALPGARPCWPTPHHQGLPPQQQLHT